MPHAQEENEEGEEEPALSPREAAKRSVEVFDMAGEQLDPLGFGPLRGVGLRMIVTSLRDQVARRLRHKAEMERLIEKEFEVRAAPSPHFFF